MREPEFLDFLVQVYKDVAFTVGQKIYNQRE